jgi:hypothetical protein
MSHGSCVVCWLLCSAKSCHTSWNEWEVHCQSEFATWQIPTFAAVYSALHHRDGSTLVSGGGG